MRPSPRGALAVSISIQGIGSAIPLLTVVVLAQVAGPIEQGTFSSFTSWVSFVSSILIFGFPQAFIYLINKGVADRGRLLNASLAYSVIAGTLTVPIALFSVWLGYNSLPEQSTAVAFSVLTAIGIGALVCQSLVRGIYLTLDDGPTFALITSAPAFFLFVATLIAAFAHGFRYDIAFFAAGLFTVLATAVWIKRIIDYTAGYKMTFEVPPKRALLAQSVHSFSQSLAFTAQPVVTIYVIGAVANSLTVGFFTAATLIFSGTNVLFAIVAPILFNRWSKRIDRLVLVTIGRTAVAVSLIFAIVGFVSIPLLSVVVTLVFGDEYQEAVGAFQVMTFAMAPVAFTRIVSPAIHAAGRPSLNTVSCGIRLGTAIIVQLGLMASGSDALVAAVWSWVVAEWAAALYSVGSFQRVLRWIS